MSIQNNGIKITNEEYQKIFNYAQRKSKEINFATLTPQAKFEEAKKLSNYYINEKFSQDPNYNLSPDVEEVIIGNILIPSIDELKKALLANGKNIDQTALALGIDRNIITNRIVELNKYSEALSSIEKQPIIKEEPKDNSIINEELSFIDPEGVNDPGYLKEIIYNNQRIIKRQNDENDKLQEDIKDLCKANNDLRDENKKLKAKLTKLEKAATSATADNPFISELRNELTDKTLEANDYKGVVVKLISLLNPILNEADHTLSIYEPQSEKQKVA